VTSLITSDRQDCKVNYRIYSMPDEHKRRWCGRCGQKCGGILITKQAREDCDVKKASYGQLRRGPSVIIAPPFLFVWRITMRNKLR
jgi:hypothetical protein